MTVHNNLDKDVGNKRDVHKENEKRRERRLKLERI